MFGQQPFGAPTTQAPAFGASSFGTPAFGSTANTIFGQPQQQPQQQQQSIFGTAPAFSTFGQPQQQQAQQPNPFATAGPSFGSTPNPFAQPSQPAQTGSIFGSTTGGLFGQPAQAQTNVFGQAQQPASSGLFGGGVGSSSGSLFGQPAKSTGFGSSTPAFGTSQPQTSTSSLFGSTPAQSGGLFGGTTSTTGGLFGAQSGGAGLFGSSSAQSSGTTIKFSPTGGTDAAMKNGQTSTVNTKNYCICTMKEYDEKKSMEELRLEDYQANRKFGTAVASTGTGGLFGQAQSSTGAGGLFGSSSFGSSFGQQAAKPTSFGTGGIFGSSATSQPSTGIFGQQAAQPSLFGQASSTPLFGQPAASSAPTFSFGTNTAPSSFGGFGQPAKPSLFGGSAFGAATTTAPSIFGSTSAAPAFGGTNAFGSFGTPSTSQSGMFGKPLFGATTTSAPSAFGSFGAGSSIFGSKPATTNAFSFSTNTTSANTLGTFPSLGFGQQQTSNNSLFAPKPAFGASASTAPFGTSSFGGFGQSSTGFGGTSAVSPFGQSASGTSMFGPSLSGTQQQSSQQQSSSGNVHAQVVELLRSGGDTDVLGNMYAQLPLKDIQQKPAPLSRDAINAFISNAKRNYTPINPSRNEEKQYKYYIAPSSKGNSLSLGSPNGPISWRPASANRDERFRLDRAYIEKMEKEISIRAEVETPQTGGKKVTHLRSAITSGARQSRGEGPVESASNKKAETYSTPGVYNVREAFDEEDSGNRDGDRFSEVFGRASAGQAEESEDDQENLPVGNRAVILSRSDYYTVPALHELILDDKGTCMVEDFLVGRYSYGNVQFLGRTNIARLNLDELVEIEDKEVTVYPNEKQKPPVGKGLNKKAIITFDNIWIGGGSEDAEMPQEKLEGFIEILRARVDAMDNAEFVEYDAHTGKLLFMVHHFSKYKLVLPSPYVTGRWKRALRDENGNYGSAKKKQASILTTYGSQYDDITKRSNDSSKENSAPYFTVNESKFLEEDRNESLESGVRWDSDDGTGDVTRYFMDMPEECSDGEWTKKCGKILMPVESKAIESICGAAGKPITGSIGSGGKNDFVCTTLNSGEYLQHLLTPVDHISGDSKCLLEEQLELYLNHCTYAEEKGSTVILQPDNRTVFIDEFCSLVSGFPDKNNVLALEKSTWELFQVLYGAPKLSVELSLCSRSRAQCNLFVAWIKSFSKRFMTAANLDVENMDAEMSTKGIFECILCGDCEKAAEIALRFHMHSIAVAIQAIDDGDDEARAAANASIDELLDQAAITVNAETDLKELYLIKALMLLVGAVELTECVQVERISVFDGLDWVGCLAICTLHLTKENNPTGICDYVYRYEAKSKEDPCCVLPSTDSAVPQFLYNMILYCCRFQYSHCVPSIGCSLRLQANYDCGSKWFLIRMFDVVGEPVDSETVQQLTWDFVAYTREVGFPHFAIAALLHTEPNIQRHSQIRLSVHALVEMAKKNSAVFEKICTFLLKDLCIPSTVVAESKAMLSRCKDEHLETALYWYQAEQSELCHDIIVNFAVPLLACCDTGIYQETLKTLSFMNETDELVYPWGKFLEMLRIVEDVKNGKCDYDTLSCLDRISNLLENCRESLRSGGQPFRARLLDGFILAKVEEGKALAQFGFENDDV